MRRPFSSTSTRPPSASAATCTANASPSPYQRACRFSDSFRWSSGLVRSPRQRPAMSRPPGACGRTANGCLLSRVTPKRRRAGPVAGQAHDDRLVGRAREDLAREGGVADAVADADDRSVEVQLAAVVGRVLVALENEPQVAERLIRLQVARLPHELLVRQVLRLLVAALADELPHLRQVRERLGVDGVVRPAGPERVLVQLDALRRHAAEHHPAQAAVADGQGLDPLLRRLAVEEDRPDRVVARRSGGCVRSDERDAGARDQDQPALLHVCTPAVGRRCLRRPDATPPRRRSPTWARAPGRPFRPGPAPRSASARRRSAPRRCSRCRPSAR